ncbi:MAG: flippase-like domain-containing protein [Actinobacteria bacterium]|nr:flippase-like domain-containing protein [Actinomycetota bacterium]
MDARGGSLSARLRRLASVLGPHFKLLAAVGTLAGVALALFTQREAIAEFDWQLSWRAFLGSVLLFAVAPLVQGLCFWLVLRGLGLPTRFDEALVIWTRSFLLRYAPTGALAFVIRIRERERLEATSGEVWTASGYEQLVALVSGAIVCVLGFALAQLWPPLAAIGICAAALAVAVAVRPRFLGRVGQKLLAERGIDVPRLLRGRALAAVIVINALGWVATGAATWTLVNALSEEPTPAFAWLVGVYAFAWLLGFLVPLLPGGLGLRDGTLVVFLATRFGTGVATALVLALRLANTLGELLAIGLTELVYRIWRRRRGTRVAAAAP